MLSSSKMENKDEYGDFEELNDEGKAVVISRGEYVPSRVRLPGKEEFIGIVSQRLGGNRMEVKATDRKVRNCRVPGRFKRSMWLRPRDIVLIKVWEFDKDKADIIYKYSSNSINQLRKRKLLDNLKEEF